MPPRYTPQEVEDRMAKRIVEALYPILIPMEEQSVQIQVENSKVMDGVARVAWQAFVAAHKKS
jgi:hypothetical protein